MRRSARSALPPELSRGLLEAALDSTPPERWEGTAGFKTLFRRLGIAYWSQPRVASPDVYPIRAEESLLYTQHPAAARRALRYGDAVRRGDKAHTYALWINGAVGYGLFAGRRIKRGEMIGEYAGRVRRDRDVQDTSYAWSCELQASQGVPAVEVVIDGRKAGNELRLVNHSAEPNLKRLWIAVDGQWRLIYAAKRAIAPDEQLLVSYGPGYWKSRALAPLPL